MKYNIKDLYFAKCRHCIMDIIMSYYENGKEIKPRPDYVDYYTILMFEKNMFTNIFNKNAKYIYKDQVSNDKEHYGEDLILKLVELSKFLDEKTIKLSEKECELVETTIEKSKNLKINYGYKR